MKTINTYWLIAINVLFVAYFAKGQSPITGKVIELSTDHSNTQSWDYLGRDMVRLKPGFHYGAVAGKSFHAGIDKNLLFPVDYISSFNDGNFNRSLDFSLPVGNIAGKEGVSPSGAASYTIPIYIPPGTEGMQPTLALSYNSQLPSLGQLGAGWMLTGLPAITRMLQTIYHDNNVDASKLISNYPYTLDGNRLTLRSGTYGSNNATYGTEAETFSLITSFTESGITGGPAWFKVEAKDGLTMEFGNSSDSRFLSASTEVMSWQLNKVYDNYGNFIEYKYIIDNREPRINEILYTGNSNTGMEPFNRIKFYYETRQDQNTMFLDGSSIDSRVLLHKIEVFCEGQRVKKYELKYNIDHDSYLNEIFEFGANGSQLNSTRFKYGNQVQAFNATDESDPDRANHEFLPVDVNGDGLKDLFASHFTFDAQANRVYDTWKLFLNNNGNFSSSPNSSGVLPSNSIIINGSNDIQHGSPLNNIADFTGDGKEDVVVLNLTQLHIIAGVHKFGMELNLLAANTDGASVYNYYNDSEVLVSLSQNCFTGDFNGDRVADVLLINSEDHIGWFYNLRTKTRTLIPNLPFDGINNKLRVVDMDGDGKNEIMNLGPSGIYIWELAQSETAFTSIYSSGLLSFLSIVFTLPIGFIPPFVILTPIPYFGDFNADGKTDILAWSTNGGWHIGYSTGRGFDVRSITLPVSDVNTTYFNFVDDFNGDGKSDIVVAYNNGTAASFHTLFSTGMSFVNENYSHSDDFFIFNFSGEKKMVAFTGDFTGDGKTDIFHVQTNSEPLKIFSYYKDSERNLIHEILDGMNKKTVFSYERINNSLLSSFYTINQTLNYPAQVINGAVYAVRTVSNPDGIGGTTTDTYSYENAQIHKQGKGFLGFSKITQANNITGISQSSEIEKIPVSAIYAMAPKKNKIFTTAGGTLISETIFTNTATVYGTTVRYFAYSSKIETKDFLRDKNIVTDYTYNTDYGNLEFTTTNYGGVETEHTTTIWVQKGSWLPNKVGAYYIDRTRNPDGLYSETKSYLYNNKGKPTEMQAYVGNSYLSQINYVYDDGADLFGNLTSTTLSSTGSGLSPRTTSHNYDSKGRFVIETTNALGQASETQYDPKWGKPVSQKSVSGLVTTYEYDAFGRIKKMKTPDAIESFYSLDFVTAPVTGPSGQIGNLLYSSSIQRLGSPFATTFYDIFGRAIKTQADGFTQTINAVQTYNNKGQLESKSFPYHDNDDTSPEITTYTYYTSGVKTGLLQLSQNSAGPTSYNCSSSSGIYTETVTNPSGQVNSKKTDATGKVIESTDNGGTLTYSYYSHGQLMETKSGSEQLAFLDYDPFGRQKLLKDPNAGEMDYVYNAFGELISQADELGNSYTMEYDLLGRITKRENSSEGAPTIWTYVPSGSAVNSIQSVTGPGGTSASYTYDYLGRVIRVSENPGIGKAFNTQYVYDQFSNISEITYPSDFKISRIYTGKGYLSKVSNVTSGSSNMIWEATTMNALGQYTEYKQGNNVITEKTFNSLGMLEGIDAGTVQNMTFDWNLSSGNLNSRTDHIKAISETFGYDNLNRLTASNLIVNGLSQGDPINISYISNGNIQNKTRIGSYSYDGTKLNAVEQVGNPASDISLETQHITYTPFNKTKTVVENNDELTITYGPDQQRKISELKTLGVLQKKIIYSGNYEKITVGSDIYEVHYIVSGQGLAAISVIENSGTPQMFYVYTDHLGSLTKIAGPNGFEYEQNFNAWGQKRNPADWSYTENSQTAPPWLIRGFTGHEHIDEFALINMNGRAYDPLLGRFNSPDNYVQVPFYSQSYNRYSYALNNPLVYTDPDGNFVWAPVIIGGIAGGIIGYNIGQAQGATGWELAAYTVGGIVIGGATGGLGSAAAASGGAFAATSGIIAASYTSSLGFKILSGGRTDLSVSFGAASYNFSQNEWGYLGKQGNTPAENIGYGFGALANLSDLVALNMGGEIDINSLKHPSGHLSATNESGSVNISKGFESGKSLFWGKGKLWDTAPDAYLFPKIHLRNVNTKLLGWMTGNIKADKGLLGLAELNYGIVGNTCASQVARALWLVGVPNLGGLFGPHYLYLQLAIRQAGIYASPYLYQIPNSK